MKRLLVCLLAAGLLVMAGCVHSHHHHHQPRYSKAGPPPWAPAHGYRHKHQGMDLIFDARLGVYAVTGHPHIYFHDGHYFRPASSHWERCNDWKKRRWKTVDVTLVPVALVRHYGGPGPGKGRGRGPGKS
jgi:hypothetical protein